MVTSDFMTLGGGGGGGGYYLGESAFKMERVHLIKELCVEFKQC